jgi:hypothetical protein
MEDLSMAQATPDIWELLRCDIKRRDRRRQVRGEMWTTRTDAVERWEHSIQEQGEVNGIHKRCLLLFNAGIMYYISVWINEF